MSDGRRQRQRVAPLRIIHVGLGGWGRSWAEELRKHPDVCETVAYVDVFPEMLETLRKELPIRAESCFPSLAAAIAATEAEAVLVTTALHGHAPVALEALDAGLHVLVEKPFASSVAEARSVVDAAKRVSRTVMVSQNYRFFPAAQAVAALLAEGTLGEVGNVTVNFRKYDNDGNSRKNRHWFLPDPLLLDMSIHHFDLMRYVLDQEPTRIFALARDPAWSHFVGHATAMATIEFDGGTVVNYQGSWVSTAPPTAWAGEWVMECQEGAIRWTSRGEGTQSEDVVEIHPLGGPPRALELPELDRYDRVGSMEEFWQAIRQGREPLTSGEANLGTLGLSLAAIESASTGAPVHVDGPRVVIENRKME